MPLLPERLDRRRARPRPRAARNHQRATAIRWLQPPRSTAAYRQSPPRSILRRQAAALHPEQPPRPLARPASLPAARIVRHEVAWAILPEAPTPTKDLVDRQPTWQTDSREDPQRYVPWGPPRALPDPR